MRKKIVSGLLQILLLASMLTLVFNIQPTKASGTIYIRADGSVDPPNAPITTFDNVTYTLIDNIASPDDGIIVERDNIIVDGDGCTLQGLGAWYSKGIDLKGRSNVTIRDMRIKVFFFGILLWNSSGNSINGNNITANNATGIYIDTSSGNNVDRNNITDNWVGIDLSLSSGNSVSLNNITNNGGYGILVWNSAGNSISENNITNNDTGIWVGPSSENSISGNNITANRGYGIHLNSCSGNNFSGNNITSNLVGILLQSASGNKFYHNNFINNTGQVGSWESVNVNVWDDGYPSGGNYWSDYVGIDANGDGIGDTPYIIDANNVDHYPLMKPWSPVPVNQPPFVPLLNGPTFCILYDKDGRYSGPWKYTASSIDPDDDDVRITFAWDDGTPDFQSDLVNSGEDVSKDQYWYTAGARNTGMHEVRAKAIDIHGAESDWSSPLKVTVVKSETLLNWTGYVVDLESYPVVTLSTEAQWIQPSFGEVSRKGFQGTWVGIGGVGEKSKLLQAGVAVIDMVPSWRWIVPFYQAVQGTRKFYEGYGWEYMFNISPNDLIETKIVMVGYNQWQISVADVTKGWTWMPPIVTFDPDMTKAEWIHEPGASGSSVASFTPIDFLKAQLTINSVPYKMGKIDSALNTVLYQFNFARKGTTYTSVSPISAYERFTISYLEAGSLLPQTEVALSLHSNADLHVYDSMGNHLGYNATSGFIDVRIPNSIYFEDEQGVQYAILFNPDKYRVDVVGKENGDFHLRTQALVNETVVLDQWVNETIGINETKTYYFIHQISLRSLAKLKTVIGQGYNCSIGVQVVNNGNYTETFNVTAYANTTIIGTQLVTLTSKNSTNINFTWNTSGFVKGSYTISAYAWPVPGETDKTDNNYTDGMVRVTMKGDCAQEFGVVDIFDLVFVAKAFDTKIGDPGYKPNADLNCDGIIDIFDLVIVAKNFDKTDP